MTKGRWSTSSATVLGSQVTVLYSVPFRSRSVMDGAAGSSESSATGTAHPHESSATSRSSRRSALELVTILRDASVPVLPALVWSGGRLRELLARRYRWRRPRPAGPRLS
jgi:hypothetical protein